MKNYIEERVKEIANQCIAEGLTVRQLAKAYCVSKSTVHKDLTERLFEVDKLKYRKVKDVLSKNKRERAVRGGEATRLKYLLEKNKK